MYIDLYIILNHLLRIFRVIPSFILVFHHLSHIFIFKVIQILIINLWLNS